MIKIVQSCCRLAQTKTGLEKKRFDAKHSPKKAGK